MSLESFMNDMRKLVIDEFAKKAGPPPDVRRYLSAGVILESATWGPLEFVRIESRPPNPMYFIFKTPNGDPHKFSRINLDFQFDDLFYALKYREDPIRFRCDHQKDKAS
jgi:hypothetical protein